MIRGMSARYLVLCSDDLMNGEFGALRWPAGLRVIDRGEAADAYSHWWLIEDDDARPELNGQRIVLSLAYENVPGAEPEAVIVERRVIAYQSSAHTSHA